MSDKPKNIPTISLESSCVEIYATILETLEVMINEPERIAEILERDKTVLTTNNDEPDALETARALEESPKRRKQGDPHKGNEEIVLCLARLFPAGTNLSKFKTLVDSLMDSAVTLNTAIETTYTELLEFLVMFGRVCGYNSFPMDDFSMLLGQGTDYLPFKMAAKKIYNLMFFQQNITSASFYELSLVRNMHRLYFRKERYVENILRLVSRVFIISIGRAFEVGRQYRLDGSALVDLSNIAIKYVNAFNGIISELGVPQKAIPQIMFILSVFNVERERSVMRQNYGDTELFYCAVRVVCDGPGFGARLEGLIHSRLFWPTTVSRPATLSLLYSTIFCCEYKKIIGGIKRITHPTGMCLREDLAHSPVLTTNVLKTTPKGNKSRTVQAFSPISRKIGEANKAGKDTFDSKRRLSFE